MVDRKHRCQRVQVPSGSGLQGLEAGDLSGSGSLTAAALRRQNSRYQ